jgi:hypothetical protein
MPGLRKQELLPARTFHLLLVCFSRHATLRAAACTLGGVLDAAGMTSTTAARLLLDAVLQAGGKRVDQRNALGTINWGLNKGAASPLAVGGR